jgi:hypothetical protein
MSRSEFLPPVTHQGTPARFSLEGIWSRDGGRYSIQQGIEEINQRANCWIFYNWINWLWSNPGHLQDMKPFWKTSAEPNLWTSLLSGLNIYQGRQIFQEDRPTQRNSPGWRSGKTREREAGYMKKSSKTGLHVGRAERARVAKSDSPEE